MEIKSEEDARIKGCERKVKKDYEKWEKSNSDNDLLKTLIGSCRSLISAIRDANYGVVGINKGRLGNNSIFTTQNTFANFLASLCLFFEGTFNFGRPALTSPPKPKYSDEELKSFFKDVKPVPYKNK